MICELWAWLCDGLSLGNGHTEYWGGCSSEVRKQWKFKIGTRVVGHYYLRWPFCAAVSSVTSKCRLGLGHCYWLLNTLYVIREQLGMYNQKQKKEF